MDIAVGICCMGNFAVLCILCKNGKEGGQDEDTDEYEAEREREKRILCHLLKCITFPRVIIFIVSSINACDRIEQLKSSIVANSSYIIMLTVCTSFWIYFSECCCCCCGLYFRERKNSFSCLMFIVPLTR